VGPWLTASAFIRRVARVGDGRRFSRAAGPAYAGLACAAVALLCGCGSGAHNESASTTSTKPPSYVTAPFTGQEQLVQQGARLFVADGCSACHSIAGHTGLGPSFGRFAGDQVELADGRRALVNEAFLRQALLEPRSVALRGYPLAPMVAAVTRFHFARRHADVTALAAFIEQIGPEG
jgi:mono/diheme cytochrome c family protein